MNDTHPHKRFHGDPNRLRAAERIAILEVQRVVALSMQDLVVKSVLDIGAGTGVFAEAFSQVASQVIGIDIDDELLAAARGCVSNAHFQAAAAEALPFVDNSFDLVFLGHVLHEIENPLQALEEARRVARSRVVVLEWPYEKQEQGPPIGRRLSPETIEGLAGMAGFQDAERIPLAHMDFYRLKPKRIYSTHRRSK